MQKKGFMKRDLKAFGEDEASIREVLGSKKLPERE
jgi:hypothetical protein